MPRHLVLTFRCTHVEIIEEFYTLTYCGADQTRAKWFVIRGTAVLTLVAVVLAAVVHIVLHIVDVIIIISGAADRVVHKLALVIFFIRITKEGETKERQHNNIKIATTKCDRNLLRIYIVSPVK